LADTTPEEIRFLKEIVGNDILGVIIRGHLFIESRLTHLIEQKLPEPGAIDLTRMNFHLKIDLAVAMGVLPYDLRPPLQVLNKLRNKLAHDVHKQITRADSERLFKSLPKVSRDVFGSPEDDKRLLQSCISHLYGRLLGLGTSPAPHARRSGA
jgi:hypothetical protein